MSGFDRHLTVGKQYGGVLAVAVFLWTFDRTSSISASVQAGVIAGVLATIASVLPDIDHQDSKPRQAAGTLASAALLVGVGLLPLIAPELLWDVGNTVAETVQIDLDRHAVGMGTAFILALVAIRIGGSFFNRVTTHRGFTHSTLFVAVIFLVFYMVVNAYATLIGTPELAHSPTQELISGGGAAGVFVHIWEDR